jgi:hypothetical protein
MVTLTRIICVCFALGVCGFAQADDKEKLELKAKAALSLAKTSPRPVKAPAPRAVEVRDYATGYNKAIVDQKPLLVFIGCEIETHDGAISSRVEGPNFGNYKGPAVVVCYPTADRLNFDSVLSCPTEPAAVKKAIHDAARKIDRPQPKRMPEAVKTAEWKIDCEYIVTSGGVLYRQ